MTHRPRPFARATVRPALSALLALAAGPVGVGVAQSCPPDQTYVSNDGLGPNPGAAPVAVIQGLCEGEAIGHVYDVSGIGSQVQLMSSSVGFFNVAGANGITALVNLKVYDGIVWNGGIPTLGPLVYDWVTQTGSSIQVATHAVNQLDTSQQNIIVSSGKLVVTWTMDFNPNGVCATGYTSNFGTDNGFGGCSSTPQANLIFIQGQGWRDPSTATVSGFPLCPLFYNGNWVMRSCVKSADNVAVYCTAKTNSFGCVPAMTTTGVSSATAGSGFTIDGTNVRNNKTGLLYGVSGRFNAPFSGGLLCVSPQVKRTPGVSAGGNPPPFQDCSGVFSLDFNAFTVGALGGNPLPAIGVPGTVVNAQWWGRDQGFPPPNNTTLTDAVEFTVGP